MEKTRKTKVIAILALVVAIVGMSLGFAAFSNILTISSSATVTPSEEDFKMVVYGIEEDVTMNNDNPMTILKQFFFLEYYTSQTKSRGFKRVSWDKMSGLDNYADISIESSRIKLSNLNGNFENPDQDIRYSFLVKNEGAYNAFINFDDFEAVLTENVQKTCMPGEDTTSELATEACKGIKLNPTLYNSDGEIMYELSEFNFNSSYMISPNDYFYLIVLIEYGYGSERADGEFSVKFEDVSFEMTSAPKGTVLNS